MRSLTKRPYEGCLITLEGGEGCGKSTLCEKLNDYLLKKGYHVFRTREPGGTGLSEHLRQILLNPNRSFEVSPVAELLLFLSSRAEHLDEKILPALQEGKVVLCERFNDSTIAYQGCARYLGEAYVEELCKLTCRGVEADITLLLDLDPTIGLRRIKMNRKEDPDRLEKEELQFHKDVRQGYLHLADRYPNRIHILDANLTIEEVYKKCLSNLR